MENRDFLVTKDGKCEVFNSIIYREIPTHPYRLYRFLTEVEDILLKEQNDQTRLQKICPLVRLLLDTSPWLQTFYLEPSLDTGWSVLTLYEEPDFDLTVQIVTWLPGNISPIHNHGTWGIIALLSGLEKNTFWQIKNDTKFPEKIAQVGSQILEPGDIISFVPDAIHSVEPLGEEATITFNIYGETDFSQRFEFDTLTNSAKNF